MKHVLILFLALIGGYWVLANAAPALACGIGQPITMIANTTPALAFPVSGASATHPLGVFTTEMIVGQPVTFSEDVTTPGFNAAAYQWTWDFGDGATANGITVAHVFTRAGVYIVRVALASLANPTQRVDPFDSAQIEVSTRQFIDPPIVRATASATVAGLGDTVTYDGTASRALVGGTVQFEWNFGDGETAQGPVVTHRFLQLGSGNVALTVSDQRGARTTALLPIRIVPMLPRAAFHPVTANLRARSPILFDARASHAAPSPGNAVADFLWDFGDGSQWEGQSAEITHTYATPGTYQVTLHITDMTGLTNQTAERITVLAASAPAAASSPPALLLVVIGGCTIAILLVAWMAWRKRFCLV